MDSSSISIGTIGKKGAICVCCKSSDEPCESHSRYVRAIHTYAQKNNIIGIQEELNKGVNINVEDHFQETPLHYASKAGNVESINFLISKGANVNYRSMYGFTPLSFACYENHYESILILLNNGAIVDITQDIRGNTQLTATTDEKCRELLLNYNSEMIKEPDID